jgi:hypothetical protein
MFYGANQDLEMAAVETGPSCLLGLIDTRWTSVEAEIMKSRTTLVGLASAGDARRLETQKSRRLDSKIKLSTAPFKCKQGARWHISLIICNIAIATPSK